VKILTILESKHLGRSHPQGAIFRSKPLPSSPSVGQGGFTLLEVLVALAILGLAVAAIFDLLRVGLLTSEASTSYTQAAFHAQSKMGELLTLSPLEAGADSGEFEDGFSFETQVTEYELADSAQTAGEGSEEATPAAEVYILEVIIRMPGQNRIFQLQTLRSIPYQGL